MYKTSFLLVTTLAILDCGRFGTDDVGATY